MIDTTNDTTNDTNPVTHLYDRLRQLGCNDLPPSDPPSFEDWLRYWNDDDSDLGNLRNLAHWLARRRRSSMT